MRGLLTDNVMAQLRARAKESQQEFMESFEEKVQVGELSDSDDEREKHVFNPDQSKVDTFKVV